MCAQWTATGRRIRDCDGLGIRDCDGLPEIKGLGTVIYCQKVRD